MEAGANKLTHRQRALYAAPPKSKAKVEKALNGDCYNLKCALYFRSKPD
jgi:hypothetical protein